MNKLIKISTITSGLFLFTVTQSAFSDDFTTDTLSDQNDANTSDGICASDTNTCSLRAAIEQANALPGPHTITLSAGTYSLTITGRDEDAAATGDLDILEDITINGAGAASTIINAQTNDRVFDIAPDFKETLNYSGSDTAASVNMNDLSITKGRVMILATDGELYDGGLGGGIYNSGDLFLNDVWIYGNTAYGVGGGIFSVASYLELNRTLIYRNVSSSGAGLGLNNGRNVINNSFIIQNPPKENPAAFLGGGIFSFSNLEINNSLIYENYSTVDGAGIYHGLGSLDIKNTTISDNVANRNGGGLFYRIGEIGGNISVNNPALSHVTITNNVAMKSDTSGAGDPVVSFIPADPFTYPDGSPIDYSVPEGDSEGALGGGGVVVTGQINSTQPDVVLKMSNSIVANNFTSTARTTLDDCSFTTSGSIRSFGGNLDSDDSCGFNQTGDVPGVDPQLVSFDINNITNGTNLKPKLTQIEFDRLSPHTQTVLETSPAIDQAVNPYCTDVDQTGRTRPTTLCDIGAYEHLPLTANSMQYVTSPSGVISSAFNVIYANTTLSYEIVTPPTQGTVGLEDQPSANGAWTFTAQAGAGAIGTDQFTYKACRTDTLECSPPATVAITFANEQVTSNVSIDIKTGTGTASPITVVDETEILAEVADVDYTFPLGAFFFDVEDVSSNVADVLLLTIQLPANTNIPADAVVRKLDNTGVWQTLGTVVSPTVSSATIDVNLKTITLNLVDNDVFDSNPAVGIIRDPVALGIPTATFVPTIPTNNSNTGGIPDSENPASVNYVAPSSGGGGSLSLFLFLLFGLTLVYRQTSKTNDEETEEQLASIPVKQNHLESRD